MTREGPGGLQFVDISNALAEATICTQGAQLLRWQPRALPQPVTFVADAAQYVAGRSVRGGIPICWPWFGPHPTDASLPSHGFARNLPWEVGDAHQLPDGTTRQSFALRDNDTTRALWPHPFRLDCCVTVGETLDIEIVSINTGPVSITITEALHTYFLVGDVGTIEVHGLEGTQYADTAAGGTPRQQAGAVRFAGEVDRVFQGTAADCTIVDPLMRRRIVIEKTGSRSTVVWNPGAQKAARLADLGDASAARVGWRQMVCIESANALDDRVMIAPGESHRIAVKYRVAPL